MPKDAVALSRIPPRPFRTLNGRGPSAPGRRRIPVGCVAQLAQAFFGRHAERLIASAMATTVSWRARYIAFFGAPRPQRNCGLSEAASPLL